MIQTGVLKCHLDTLVPCILYLYLYLLAHVCVAAPGLTGAQRMDSSALSNPFGSGPEEHKLLQSYIHSSMKESDVQAGTEINTWEEGFFYLFHLYDFDRSGLLDGLEMMKLISDYNSHHAPGAQTNELVVSMVDFLLRSHDRNLDGRIAPSELLSPLPPSQDPSIDHAANQVQEEAAAGGAEQREEAHAGDQPQVQETARVAEQGEEAHAEEQPQVQEQPQQDTGIQEEHELVKQAEGQTEEHIPEVVAAEQEHHQAAPVHQGQPEM